MTRQLACKGPTGGLQAGEDGHDVFAPSPFQLGGNRAPPLAPTPRHDSLRGFSSQTPEGSWDSLVAPHLHPDAVGTVGEDGVKQDGVGLRELLKQRLAQVVARKVARRLEHHQPLLPALRGGRPVPQALKRGPKRRGQKESRTSPAAAPRPRGRSFRPKPKNLNRFLNSDV
eukprot:3424106-Pyramimonas_sp.AAC.1